MSTSPGHIGRYELQQPVRQERMSEVWKAFDPQTHRYVAIKLLHAHAQNDSDFATRFQRDMPTIAALHHPNIVQYHDFAITQPAETGDARAYAVMDYVDGSTLAEYIRTTSRQGKFLPTADIVRLFSAIGKAVAYAHERGVIHGQLNPGNVLLDRHNVSRNAMGEPLVTDFGMLNLLGVAASNTSGWQVDTLLYTSPEQIMGAPANERSDQYSLGIMLYEVCTGTPPFVGNNTSNTATLMMQHTSTIATLPALINPNLSSALTTIIMRSIAKDPWARFPSVAALLEALAQVGSQEGNTAIPSSIPMNVAVPDYPTGALDMPTVLTSPPHAQAGMTPASFTPALHSGDGGVGAAATAPVMQQGGTATPVLAASLPEQSAHGIHNAQSVSQAAPLAPVAAIGEKKTSKSLLWTVLVVLLLLIVVGSSLGAYFAFFAKGASRTTQATSLFIGHAYFVSSGLLSSNPESNQGITDQVQIRLTDIAPPQSGKAYYAWLLNDIHLDTKAIPLGQLSVTKGTATLAFGGDAIHSNLLAANSRLLITEEDSAVPPVSPSFDPTTYRYYAEFSQKPAVPQNPKSFSLYDHIRHLLASDPTLAALGLTGGLDIWLYRNTQKILEWAGSARDAWKDKNAAFIQRQLTRIIDYIDGTQYAQKDLPGQPILANPTIAKIGMLTFDPLTQNPPGYLYHIDKHLREIIALPEASAEQKALASEINTAINEVDALFTVIRLDVLQLYHMPATQLLGSNGLTLLDTVATDANDAFVGQINTQAQVTDGVVQIHYAIQRMATFDVRACTTANPCSI